MPTSSGGKIALWLAVQHLVFRALIMFQVVGGLLHADKRATFFRLRNEQRSRRNAEHRLCAQRPGDL